MNTKIFNFATTALIGMIFLSSCSKDNLVLSPVSPEQSSISKLGEHGYVYTQSNKPSGNTIISYEQHMDGSLELDTIVMTGGMGLGAPLGSQGAVMLNKNHTRLFAVNAGDNTVSSFSLDGNGIPTLQSVISSGGIMPISLTVHDNYLYVVNFSSANIAGFMIGNNGSLSPLSGSSKPLSAMGAEPAQISFRPDGKKLVVTEKATSKITTYSIDANGMAGSPISFKSKGETPFGFEFNNNTNLVVSNAEGGEENKSSVTSYYDGLNGPVADGPEKNRQTAACWLVIAKKQGNYLYVTNTGSNNISSYSINENGMLTLTYAIAATSGAEPTDMVLSGGDQEYVYNINSGSQTITGFSREADGNLTQISQINNLPLYAVGLAAY
jgi:6-phosphogluconolactonase (cycloisomerase 2 family)